MAVDLNQVSLVGNLVRDPELKVTTGGKSLCTFAIAVNDDYGETKKVSYFDITVWGKQAENCNTYISKGKRVGITGKLRQDRWQNDQQQNRSKVGVTAHFVQFLTPKDDNGGGYQGPTDQTPPPPTGNEPPVADGQSDDIPF